MLRPDRKSADGSVGEILGFNSEGVIEAGPIVLPCDRGSQFNELSLGKFLPQAGEQCVRNFHWSLCHAIGIFENHALQL